MTSVVFVLVQVPPMLAVPQPAPVRVNVSEAYVVLPAAVVAEADADSAELLAAASAALTVYE